MYVIRTLQELESVAPLWNVLTEKLEEGSVHSVFQWLHSWWCSYLDWPDVFPGSMDLLVVVIEDNDAESFGIAPLMVEANGECRTIRFLGEGVSDFADFLVKGDRREFFRGLLSILEKEFSGAQVDLQQFPKNSRNYAPFLAALSEKEYAVRESVIEKCPFLSINGDWNAYYASVSKKHRYDASRCSRRLSEQGELVFRRFDLVEENKLELFSSINIQRQHSLNRLSLYENPFKNGFLRRVTKDLNNIGMMDAAALFLSDRMITYVYGFLYRNTHYYWNISFLPEYARYSPGKILLQNLIADSFERGYKEFDFMRGDEDYKFIWARDFRLNMKVEFKIH